jgi:lipopolysaccharide transport system permease protein
MKQFSIIVSPLLSIFSHGELLKGFVFKEIKGRFAGSFGGLIWTILTPLATIIAYFFVFSIILRVNVTPEETGTDKFVIFFLCGFFPWTMFAESLGKAVGILVGESNIITKVVFPVELLPISIVISTYLINGIGFGIVLIYLAFNGYLNATWMYIPILLMIGMLFTLGLSFFLSAICVFIRDIGELFGIVIMLWFFGTPIIYPVSMVPERLEFIFYLNPMVDYVNNFRNCILMDTIDIQSLIVMCVFALVSYCAGAWFFVRSKSAFGDVL